ncbi:MAG TPA: glycine cleavage system protein H, partial [Acetobacterium sp.]|nr:glycine cleavage system protein H [Acetobacterium sp.]
MSESICVLPCNGLDKCAGDLSRRVALELAQSAEVALICPVLLNQTRSRYEKALAAGDLTIIDGCNTRCASKLAGDLELAIKDKVNVSEVAKTLDIKLGVDIQENDDTRAVVQAVLAKVNSSAADQAESEFIEPEAVEYNSFSHGKFIFKVPQSNYFFNENDCWVTVSGKMARV